MVMMLPLALLDLGLLKRDKFSTLILNDSIFNEFRFWSSDQIDKSLEKDRLVFRLVKGFVDLNIVSDDFF